MVDLIPSWTWISLVLLGSFHGLNPAMGWLFAVAIGLQERRARAVTGALGPIAIGHAMSIAFVAGGVWVLGAVMPHEVLMVTGGAAMLGFAAHKVVTRFRHPTWVGMRVHGRDLVAWSFLMATAHGAGLMLVPPLLALWAGQPPAAVAMAGPHAHHASVISGGDGLVVSIMAVGLHTLAMFVVTGAIAAIVYRKVGVDILRRAWVNLDLIWIGILALAGVATMGMGAWQLTA